MLTKADIAAHENGNVTFNRVGALRHALLVRAADARAASYEEGIDERFAASLRGKANAFQEAAGMANRLLKGEGIPVRKFSPAWFKAQAYRLRKRDRVIDADT